MAGSEKQFHGYRFDQQTLKTTAGMSRKFQTSVLVVGAGPIGLSLALDLAWRGVDCILIDQGDGTMPHSKIGLISVRSMELFRRWGMVDRVRQCGFPDDYPLNMVFCTSLAGYTIGISEYPSSRDDLPTSVSPETKQRCPQLWLDPILARCVGEYERAQDPLPLRIVVVRADSRSAF